MSSIQSRIVGAIVISSLVIAIVIASISLNAASKIIETESTDKFSFLSENYAYNFSQRLIKVESTIDTLSSTIERNFHLNAFRNQSDYRETFMSEMNSIIETIGGNTDLIYGVYFIVNPELTKEVYESWYVKNEENIFVYQEPEDISDFYPENESVEWYYKPIASKTGVWSTPYVDATINVNMISYTKAIFQGENLVGVAGIDIQFDDIQQAINDMQIYDTGYALLLDEQIRILIHPTVEVGVKISEIEGEDLRDLETQMLNVSSSVVEYRYENQDKMMGFSKLTNDWILAIAVVSDEISQPILKLRRNIFLALIVITPLIIFSGIKLAKTITAPIVHLSELAVEIANGNHDINIDVDFTHEIGELAKSFSVMTKKLVTSHKELTSISENLEYLAYHDALTGLPNRRFAKLDLESIINNPNESRLLSGIMLVDIDDFKDVNDTLGHDVGDQLLRAVSKLMKECLRSKDTVYRIGGDEFMIIFNNMDSVSSVEHLAKRINDATSEPVILKSNTLHVTCSIGVAILNDEISESNILFKYADVALYNSKDKGKNTFSIYSD
ncbi:MAG: diguanylate cyclase [Clostridiales bacterium]|nr:diguanylate cyclase [Clostridiales bacterium]